MSANPQRIPAHAQDALFANDLIALLSTSGSASHEFVVQLNADPHMIARATLADVMHHLGILHGRRPGMFDIIENAAPSISDDWLRASSRAFAAERDLITRLVVALGPPPGRMGQTRVGVAVDAARNALLTLAGSERLGCAIGAASALLLDWENVSPFLHQLAIRFEIPVHDTAGIWPDRAATLATLEAAAALPSGPRAVAFGFKTLLAQHRAFWDIVQTRAG